MNKLNRRAVWCGGLALNLQFRHQYGRPVINPAGLSSICRVRRQSFMGSSAYCLVRNLEHCYNKNVNHACAYYYELIYEFYEAGIVLNDIITARIPGNGNDT